MADQVSVLRETEPPDTSRYKDFDAALNERNNEVIVVQVGGKRYTLPAELPAKLILSQLRYLQPGGVLPTNFIPEWLETLVGKANMDDMLERGMTWNQLEELTLYLLEEYGLFQRAKEGDDDEESPKSEPDG